MARLSVGAKATTFDGSGVNIGDTTAKLSALTDIYGIALAMTDFGDKGFGDGEPGTGNEESITFSGITIGVDGKPTLTGVKSVLSKSPYTEVSGFLRGHSGGTRFVISATPAFYADQKAYIDAALVAGAPDATAVLKGLSEIATDAELQAGTATGSSGPLFAGGASHTQTPTANKIPVAASTGKIAQGWLDLAASWVHTGIVDITANLWKLGGVAFTGTMALLNEATDFFNTTAITGAQATSLTDGSVLTTLHSHARKSLTAARDLSIASGTQVIAHGLGVTPKWVKITAMTAMGGTSTVPISVGYYDGLYSTVTAASVATTVIVRVLDPGTLNAQTATIAYDATNLTLTWTKTGSAVGSAYMLIEVGV